MQLLCKYPPKYIRQVAHGVLIRSQDWIFGSGTGGVIAVYLGRFHLTLRECEEFYDQLGSDVYSQPFSNWNLYQTCKYDDKSLECVVKQQTKRFLEPNATALPFLCSPGRTSNCKACVSL